MKDKLVVGDNFQLVSRLICLKDDIQTHADDIHQLLLEDTSDEPYVVIEEQDDKGEWNTLEGSY